MKTILLLLCLVMSSVINAERVTLQFNDPNSFFDIRQPDRSLARSVESFEKSMRLFLEEALGDSNNTLVLTFNNIDLAGEVEYFHNNDGRGLRILRNTANVRLEFDFTIQRESGARETGSIKLREFYDPSGIESRRYNRDSLYYEKQLLSDWLQEKGLIE